MCLLRNQHRQKMLPHLLLKKQPNRKPMTLQLKKHLLNQNLLRLQPLPHLDG